MTFRIITFGCKMNAYESQALREALLKVGMEERKEGEADFFFVNTCAVTKTAEKKDLKTVRELGRDFPHSKIYVFGCSSQLHKEAYLDLPGVIKVYGTSQREKMAAQVLACQGKDNVEENSRQFDFDPLSIEKAEHKSKAYIKVQDGCNNFCSYCIVPYTRGVSRSRNPALVMDEARRLLENGYKEIIIGGIDVGSYQAPNDPNYRLKHLLRDLATLDNEKTYRVRVSSIESSQIDDEYIELFKKYPDRICPHFHIPLQSGSETILKAMHRKYDLDYFLSMTEKIKKEIPKVALSTDVILGFPGESEEEFEKTYQFIEKIGFMRIHAFPYSERPGTVASRIKEGIVDMSIRRERTKKIIELGKRLEQQFRKDHAGEEVHVLIESKNKDGKYQGYSENYLEYQIESEENILDSFFLTTIS